MRATSAALMAGLALCVAACGQEAPSDTDSEADRPADSVESATQTANSGSVEGATPLEERVATLGLLNKRNNLSLDIEMRPGEVREEGAVIITLAACERTAPWEMPQETGAFVQLDVLERGEEEHSRVFSGWLFKESPSLNVVEHPIYDVWVKDCAMRFPGESPAEAPAEG